MIIFGFLSILLSLADNYYYKEISDILPDFLYTSREIAKTLFSMEVASLMAMLTITFSIMVLVLTIYSSQLSPRTLQDYLGEKITQRIMGFFIGSITFSLISLFFVKTVDENNPMISPMFGVLLFLVAIVLFAFFIHYVSKSIQINIYIQNLVKDTDALIKKKQDIITKDPRITSDNIDKYEDILKEDHIEIRTEQSGFIQFYDEEKLYNYSKKNNVIIWCEKRVGEHVLEDSVIIKIFKKTDDISIAECAKTVNSMIIIGDETNLYENLGAGTKKLVEIAIRALSKGINDPNTAIFCIEKIGFLLQKLAKGLDAKIYLGDDKDVKLIVQSLTFDKLLFHHFYQIKHYGIDDIGILDAILGALITIAKDNNYMIKKEIWSFGKYILSGIDYNNKPVPERMYINERLYQLAKETRQEVKFEDVFNSNNNKG
jgi:uncharacterized membrane protein